MKCPMCGYEQAIYDDINEWWHCPQCHGSGEVQMTEQEYIQTCNTEQLAEVLADVSLWIHPFMKQKNRFELLKKQFYDWLKQPHNTGGTK